MAYAATITGSTRLLSDGRRLVTLLVEESEVAAGSEYAITNGSGIDLPRSGYIAHVQAELVSGTAATIQPRWGQASGWSDDTASAIDGLDTAADYHAEGVALPFTLAPTGVPTIYGRSTPNAGSDNVVKTRITILEQG
jgi:hypothetical protein